jgi:hypothetical protein
MDEGGATRENADDVASATQLLVEALLAVVGPDPSRVLEREAREREQVRFGIDEELGGGRLALESCDDAVELGLHLLVIGAKIVWTSVATIAWAAFGTRVSRFPVSRPSGVT